MEIEPGEERDHLGRILCEDCSMIAMSPMKACDPWAIHSAKTLEKQTGNDIVLSIIQSDMLKILKEKGPMEPSQLLDQLEGNMSMADLERQFASLRHMEKAIGEKQGMKVLWKIW